MRWGRKEEKAQKGVILDASCSLVGVRRESASQWSDYRLLSAICDWVLWEDGCSSWEIWLEVVALWRRVYTRHTSPPRCLPCSRQKCQIHIHCWELPLKGGLLQQGLGLFVRWKSTMCSETVTAPLKNWGNKFPVIIAVLSGVDKPGEPTSYLLCC